MATFSTSKSLVFEASVLAGNAQLIDFWAVVELCLQQLSIQHDMLHDKHQMLATHAMARCSTLINTINTTASLMRSSRSSTWYEYDLMYIML